MPLRYLVLFILLLCAWSLMGQRAPTFSGGRGAPNTANRSRPDSIQRPPLSYNYFKINRLGFLEKYTDTISGRPLFTDLQNQDLHHLRLGNAYSSTMPADWERKSDPGVYMGLRSYQVYDRYFHPDIISSPNRPVAIAEYGTRFGDGLNNIIIQFNRTFARQITFGFNVFSGKSDGQFQNQESNHNRLDFNLLQSSKKGRRSSYAHFSIYRNGEEMNGGLTDPGSINTPIVGGNINRSVNSTDGAAQLKNTNFKLGTSVLLGVDSIKKPVEKMVFVEMGSKAERFGYTETNISENDMARYAPLRLASGSLDNRMYNRNYYLKSGVQLKSQNASASGSIHLINNRLRRDSLDDVSGLQTFAVINADYAVSQKLNVAFNGYQSVTGISESRAAAQLNYGSGPHKIRLAMTVSSNAPNVFQNRFAIGGIEQWANDFINEKHINTILAYTNDIWKTTVDLSFVRVEDLIYFTPIASYGQSAEPFTIYRASIRQSLSFFGLTLDNHFLIQSVSDDQILPLPQLSSRHDLSTRLSFFKKRLNTRFGCIVWLQDATPLPSYHPVINDFYFPGNEQMARYIRVLPYLRATIDSFEVFVSADDVINQAFNRHHFSVNGYAEFDSRINLGVRWMFLD